MMLLYMVAYTGIPPISNVGNEVLFAMLLVGIALFYGYQLYFRATTRRAKDEFPKNGSRRKSRKIRKRKKKE